MPLPAISPIVIAHPGLDIVRFADIQDRPIVILITPDDIDAGFGVQLIVREIRSLDLETPSRKTHAPSIKNKSRQGFAALVLDQRLDLRPHPILIRVPDLEKLFHSVIHRRQFRQRYLIDTPLNLEVGGFEHTLAP